MLGTVQNSQPVSPVAGPINTAFRNIVGVIVPTVLLYLTFAAPTMDLDHKPTLSYEPKELAASSANSEPLAQSGHQSGQELPKSRPEGNLTARAQLMMAEYEKCCTEIKMKQEQEETWVDHKLLFLGALLAGFVVNVMLRGKAKNDEDPLDEKHLTKVLTHDATLIMLAAGFAGAIIMDMHIRPCELSQTKTGFGSRIMSNPS